jgi:hypothetical protein
MFRQGHRSVDAHCDLAWLFSPHIFTLSVTLGVAYKLGYLKPVRCLYLHVDGLRACLLSSHVRVPNPHSSTSNSTFIYMYV